MIDFEDIPRLPRCFVASEITLTPNYLSSDAAFGRTRVLPVAPHWTFSGSYARRFADMSKEVEALLEGLDGTSPLRVCDSFRAVPAFYKNLPKHLREEAVRPVSCVGFSAESRSVLLEGFSGEVITQGDPIAFLHEGIRHYYRAKETKTLVDGSASVEVNYRPQSNVSGFNSELDRVRPDIAIDAVISDGSYSLGKNFGREVNISGVEYWRSS